MTRRVGSKRPIPLYIPPFTESEVRAVARVMRSKRIGGNGPVGFAVEHDLAKRLGVHRVLLTTSCTHALELALMVLNVGPGDEVILPSFSFVSTANAVLQVGAKPVFAEIEPLHLTLDWQDVEANITKHTKAIICVHYAGFPCEMAALKRIASRYRLSLIEDAAQALGSQYGGQWLGTVGDIGCFSFHETKNVTCGEGGAFVTNNPVVAQRAEILREKGTNRSDFLHGKVDRYTWVDRGSSYVLSEILAAILREQLKKLPWILTQRRRLGRAYLHGLQSLTGLLELPPFEEGGHQFNWHIFYALARTARLRDVILHELQQRGIGASFHFLPLHLSPFERTLGYRGGELPVTEDVSQRLIRLPLYPTLSSQDQHYIMKTLHEIAARVNGTAS